MKELSSKKWISESIFVILYIAVVVAIALPRSLFGMDMEDG